MRNHKHVDFQTFFEFIIYSSWSQQEKVIVKADYLFQCLGMWAVWKHIPQSCYQIIDIN